MNGILYTINIHQVTQEFMDNILSTEQNGKYGAPYGLFYRVSKNGKYIGMDNYYGHAWMKEFDSYGECMLWLLGRAN